MRWKEQASRAGILGEDPSASTRSFCGLGRGPSTPVLSFLSWKLLMTTGPTS